MRVPRSRYARRLSHLTCVVALGALAALSSSGCARNRDVRFSLENARAHVDMLAGTIGSRPAGSANNAKARAYLIDQLRLYGFDVRVQETDAVRKELGMTARVANIIATKPGPRPDAIGLVAHYDSVPEAPGALDDGLGVAVCLEAARVLAALPGRTHSLMVILTDGEELGLMGAAAVVTDADVTGRLKAYLNVEAIGAAGESILFESGPRNVPLLDAWASGAPHPRGSAYTTEIYKRLPNDTDFTIFRGRDIPGLNFSPVGDSYAYHTSRDTPERLQNATIRHTGESVVATAIALDQRDLTARGADDGRYFDVVSRRAFVYSPFWGRVLAIVTLLIAVVAWVRLLRHVGERGVLKAVVSFLWALLVIAAAVGAMLGGAWLLRASREVFHPWYASPVRLLCFLIAAGVTGPWYVTRLMHLLPEGAQSLRSPAGVWALTLPIWAALAVTIETLAPAASHLWVLPLLAASVLLLAVPPRLVRLTRAVSLIVAALAAALWVRDGVDLFVFIVAVMGRMPVVTPFWLFPVFVAFVGVVVAPPIVAALAGLVRGRLPQMAVSATLLLALAVTTALAYRADAYTPERPLRRAARYVHDVALGQAWWEVGSNEPGLDLTLSPADSARWRALPQGPARTQAASASSTASLVAPLPSPFAFRADAPPTEAPVDLVAAIASRGNASDIEITLVPKQESLSATIVLPAGVEPTEVNLAGRRTGLTNRWRATFAAIPTSGIAFRATVPAALAAKLAETVVIITASRGPGAGQPRVPTWMPQARAEWSVQSRWILQPPLTRPVESPAGSPIPGAVPAPAPAPPTPPSGTVLR